MKVLFIHCAYRVKSGEDAVVAEEKKLLEASGIKTDLLLFDNEKSAAINLFQLPFNAVAYRRTRKKIRRFQPDVVHVHNLHFAASPSVIYAAKHSGVPVVCTLHNFRLLCPSGILFHHGKAFLHSLHESFPWTAIKQGAYRNSKILTAWLAFSTQVHRWLRTWQLPDRFIVLSEHARDLFLKSSLGLNEEKLVVKPNFAPSPAAVNASRQQHFLFAGRLDNAKGLPLLLEVFAHAPYQLRIAGDGPLKKEVERFATTHSNIDYLGVLPKEELLKQMQAASALLFPSVWYEGMPLTIIEAFACGLPVIASKLGAMENMVSHNQNGLLFEAGKAAALKDALHKWASLSEAEKIRYGAKASKTYEAQYTPKKNAELLLSIYRSVQKNTSPVLCAVPQSTT